MAINYRNSIFDVLFISIWFGALLCLAYTLARLTLFHRSFSASQTLLSRTYYRLYNICMYTDKKENKIFLIYKEIQMGSGDKPYMRKGFLIYEEMRKYLVIYEEAVCHIWLCNRSRLNFLIYKKSVCILYMKQHFVHEFPFSMAVQWMFQLEDMHLIGRQSSNHAHNMQNIWNWTGMQPPFVLFYTNLLGVWCNNKPPPLPALFRI